MITQNWPDPKRPGVPLFPERDGWHVLRTPLGTDFLASWDAGSCRMFNIAGTPVNKDFLPKISYIGPALTPTQINEMLAAERERCASVVISHAISPSPIDDPHPDAEWLNGCKHSARAIRNLGAAT